MVPLSKSGVPKGTVGSNPTLSARQGGLYGSQKCARGFAGGEELSYPDGWCTAPPYPSMCREKKDDIWIVQFKVGFVPMEFEINALTGEILRYCECR